MTPKFMVTTLGCKVNQYEAAAMAETLRRAGLADYDGAGPVALCVVHTCCVTAVAAGKSRRMARRLAAAHPQARLVVTGCCATADADALRRLPGVTAAVGHHDDLAAHLIRLADEVTHEQAARIIPPQGRAHVGRCVGIHNASGRPNAVSVLPSPTIKPLSGEMVKDFHACGTGSLAALERFDGRHRAIVKVQDGCDAFCTYCIVPHLRPRPASRGPEQVLPEVRRLVAAGHMEIVLCGVCLGAYGRATTRRDRWAGRQDHLAQLLGRVSEEAGPARVRLSSLDPADVSDSLLNVMAERPNICAHPHLPLQSGSATMLARMNRQYTPDQYAAAVARARERLDAPAITTDVIVGFPGEGEEDFAATLAMASKVGFARIHIFPFSPRQGTPAARWRKDRPAAEIVRRRCAELARLQRHGGQEYRAAFVGRTVEVLLETPDAGLSRRYIRVSLSGRWPDRVGQIVAVSITGQTPDGLVGRMAADQQGRRDV